MPMVCPPKKAPKDVVAAYKERVRAAGRFFIHIHLPKELIGAIDQLKVKRGMSARDTLIEDALRFYIDQQIE